MRPTNIGYTTTFEPSAWLPPITPPAHTFTAHPRMGIFSPSGDGGYTPTSPTPPSSSSATRQGRAGPAHPDPPLPSRAAAIAASSAIKNASKGFPESGPSSEPSSGAASKPAAAKKLTRDSKRRATHSQIERRRREKINDRLITLRNLVPACTKEVEDRQKARIEEELQSARIAAGLIPSDAKGKRKRNRRRATQAKKEENSDKDAELGLHKLEVLTHTIDYIYQLEARIEELETGVRPARIRRVIDRDEEADEEEDEEDEESVNKDGPDVKMDVRQQGDKAAEQERADDDDDDDDDGEAPARRIRRRGSVLNIASLTSPDPSLYRGAHRSSPIKEGSSESSSTSSNASPPLTDATSPMFSATRNGSSCVSSLTSPFMSLSASSPILLGTKGGRTSPTQAYFGHLALPPSALSGFTNGTTHGATTFHSQRRAGDASSARTPHGSLSAIRSDAMSNGLTTGHEHRASPGVNDASAAELLLAFSNSPEDALRPVGATPRPGNTARRARISLPRRKTASDSVAQQGPRCTSGANPANSAFAQERGQAQGRERKFSSAVTASAPGGAVAVEERRLLSPPLLALDDPTRAH
ncbi:unnamed protein product [Jaminaea pallidilutea]